MTAGHLAKLAERMHAYWPGVLCTGVLHMNYMASMPSRQADINPSPEARLKALRQYGSFALAYSAAFQPGMHHFGDGGGFLAYRMVGRTAYVLGDPLGPREQWPGLIDAFVTAKQDVTFWQMSRDMASLLAQRGFSVNELGVESWLDLEAYDFAGPRKRSFRTATNRFFRTGHHVAELPPSALDPSDLRAISLGWRRTRTTSRRELSFLVRPVQLVDEPEVRKFFLLDSGGRPVAFAFFDPLYREGKLTGYLSATRRWLPDADPLAAYFLVRRAIEAFKAEGVPRLYLGLMPFHRIDEKDFPKDWLTKRAFRLLHTNALAQRFVYPTQSLARHKESYGGECRQTYCAMNKRPSLPRLLKLIRACGIV
ncbi:DUF2156 domain-containing protein [Nitratireductor luteus]|uniref:DUF2156 domain-containing protein n=1 Tax=Nitratireductor luteus TaxID=2976980 RepID=UPI0022401F27|nr:DUF2156 domain-containing protein [Nitratireductor luteus]